MRNMPIPVDTSRLTFVVVAAPRPKLVSQETGEVKIDKSGRTVYTVGLSAADESGRAELINVSVSGEPDLSIGQVVRPAGLVGFTWEQMRNGELRWGVSYRAESIAAATAAKASA